MEVTMKFEFLPNEIIIICYEYLNAPDLFNAFDQLNYRFQTLIQNISLRLNFQHVTKTMFDQFCNRMLLSPEIKNQIYSLQLSNAADTCGQITAFLSFFSLDEFYHLRSLTLINVKEKEVQRLSSMLPSLSNLYYCCFRSKNINDKIFGILPLSNIRKLVMGDLSKCSMLTQNTIYITHLTVSKCFTNDLFKLFTYAPMLKYLSVQNVKEDDGSLSNELCFANTQAVCLTQLSLDLYAVDFNCIEILLKQIPNLKTLRLSSLSLNSMMFDAARWQHLISLSLSNLQFFKFYFANFFTRAGVIDQIVDSVVEKLKQFQTAFWHQQHHWHTAYELEEDSVSMFTIPCIEDDYILTSSANIYYNTAKTDANLFDKITELTLHSRKTAKQSHVTFSNVISLTLEKENVSRGKSEWCLPEGDVVESVKSIVNFSNLKHLDIGRDCGMESPLILLQILKEAPHLSSLTIWQRSVIPLLDSNELCGYFNKMVTKLFIRENNFNPRIHNHQLERIWEVFSNLEQLRCDIELENLPALFNRLPKLSNLTFKQRRGSLEYIQIWLHNNVAELNNNFLLDIDDEEVHIWIGRR